MIQKLNKVKEEILNTSIHSNEDLEIYRLKYLSRKGLMNELFDEFKKIPNEEKRAVGQLINELKLITDAKITEAQQQFGNNKNQSKQLFNDLSLSGEPIDLGARHPLLITQNKIVEIFNKLGFVFTEGPEIENDWHNFSGLNFPQNHPARDTQDTFFVDKDIALRTHTSSVQVRLMETEKPPIRAIMPGRVYRNEAISARAHCFFHQIEGIYINENVSFADLKQTLYHFVKEMFGKEFNIRFRPSYFPFTEPSAEMDISCMFCKGEGCNICKHSGWVEILGCGMVDPEVLKSNHIDSEKYTGFAFGMGIERITMLLYNVKDLRVFSNNDVRFLKQFSGVV
jgi:phenylalanyl-tRNA synthetase alpha chain